jgi:D-serine deaminase-like pyridoxal phosphate-dependent protein
MKTLRPLRLETEVDARKLTELETPVPVVDLDRLAHNLDRMASYAAIHSLALRPHVKTHKSPRIAAEQLRLGAAGLTCATPRELEVMSDVSGDILVAYPLLGGSKLGRAMAVPHEVRLTVALDSAEAVDQLSRAAHEARRAVGVYVEVDLGMHRVGVQSAEDAIALVERVKKAPGLEYRGIAYYPGHIRQPAAEQDAALERLSHDLRRLLRALEWAGHMPEAVSGGSTPTAWRSHEIEGVTEIRPGTYVYNDRATAEMGACAWEDCAFTVLATVVSTSVPGQAVVDAGSKALGREPFRGEGEAEGFACVMDRRDVCVARMSEEHGVLDLSKTDWRPEVGEQVRLVPNHVCVVVHLNDVIYGVRDDVVETWWPVTARGRAAVPAGGGAPERGPGSRR